MSSTVAIPVLIVVVIAATLNAVRLARHLRAFGAAKKQFDFFNGLASQAIADIINARNDEEFDAAYARARMLLRRAEHFLAEMKRISGYKGR